MVKYGSIERQYMTGGVRMIQVTLMVRMTLIIAFIVLSYWALQGIQIEKILKKGAYKKHASSFYLSPFGWAQV